MSGNDNRSLIGHGFSGIKTVLIGAFGGGILALIADQRVVIGVLAGILLAVAMAIPHQWRHHWKPVAMIAFIAYCATTSSWGLLMLLIAALFAFKMVSGFIQIAILLVLTLGAVAFISSL